MYRHILIAADGSKPAERALAAGLSLAKHLGARASVIVVDATFNKALDAASVLRSAAAASKEKGIACECVHAESAEIHDAVIAQAREKGCDLIVMGSSGTSGLALELLGSVTQKLLTISTIPVLVYR